MSACLAQGMVGSPGHSYSPPPGTPEGLPFKQLRVAQEMEAGGDREIPWGWVPMLCATAAMDLMLWCLGLPPGCPHDEASLLPRVCCEGVWIWANCRGSWPWGWDCGVTLHMTSCHRDTSQPEGWGRWAWPRLWLSQAAAALQTGLAETL